MDGTPNGESFSSEVTQLQAQVAQLQEEASAARSALASVMATNAEQRRLLEQAATERVVNLELAAERSRFYALLMDIPAGIMLMRGYDMVVELSNPLYLSIVGRQNSVDHVGKTLLQFLPELEGQPFLELLREVLRTGKPFIGHELMARLDREGTGTTKEYYFNFIYQAVTESDGTRSGVLAHVIEVTDHVIVRRTLEAQILERQKVEARLQAEIQERTKTEAEMRAKLAIIEKQEADILALATPILQIWDSVLALPVIGTVDAVRAGRMKEALLAALSSTRARFAIVDLTGVDTLDTVAADHLLRIVRSTRLLGSQCLVSGISPKMAETIVDLNIERVGFMSFNTLEIALRYAMRQLQPATQRD